MSAAYRSELLKLLTRRSAIGIAGMVAFMAVTMLITVGGAGEEPSDRGPVGVVLSQTQLAAGDGLGRSLGNAATVLGITALTMVASTVGSEFTDGTVRNLLLRQPRRGRLLLGTALGQLTYVVAAVLAATIAGIVAAFVLAAGNDVATSAWRTTDGLVATGAGVGNLLVAVTGWAALGLVLAVLLRSAAPAIGVGVAYALPIEILLAETISEAARWLPGQVMQAVARGGSPWLGHGAALTRTIAWTALAVLAAVLVFHRRDVTD